ncbi:MAG: hypothetical protein HZA31_06320 [Opitutae bacterium]|nr:hypothetical protein [Opitutae bacterium]
MKKILLISVACLLLCIGCFIVGVRYGEFNGRVEAAAKDTGPLMNLLLIGAGKEKELVQMNREQLYMNLGLFESLRTSHLVSGENRRLVEQRILLAKDYWQAVGGTILQTEEEKKKNREQVAAIQSAAGVPMTLMMNGVKVSPFYFEEQDQRARDIFSQYADQKSYLYDFIVSLVEEAKKRQPNPERPETMATAVTPAADAASASPAAMSHP